LDGWERIPVGALGYSIRIDQRNALESVFSKLFSDIVPATVEYTFINGTLTDLKMYINGILADTIKWLDTLSVWDYKGAPVLDIIEFRSIVATDNYLYWLDTLRTGQNFQQRYYVSNEWFLLGVLNSTNKTMNSCVVSNFLKYDSSSVYLQIGEFKSIGYYKSAMLTDIRLYFNSTSNFIYWNDINTISTTSEAMPLPLEASLILPKITVKNEKINYKGSKRVYYLKTYKKEKNIN